MHVSRKSDGEARFFSGRSHGNVVETESPNRVATLQSHGGFYYYFLDLFFDSVFNAVHCTIGTHFLLCSWPPALLAMRTFVCWLFVQMLWLFCMKSVFVPVHEMCNKFLVDLMLSLSFHNFEQFRGRGRAPLTSWGQRLPTPLNR